jgi:hypothetical protein
MQQEKKKKSFSLMLRIMEDVVVFFLNIRLE